MDKDPNSYRVPILRLSDVAKKKAGDAGADARDTDAQNSSVAQSDTDNTPTNSVAQSSQVNQPPQPSPNVSEEDVAAAIITPSKPTADAQDTATQKPPQPTQQQGTNTVEQSAARSPQQPAPQSPVTNAVAQKAPQTQPPQAQQQTPVSETPAQEPVAFSEPQEKPTIQQNAKQSPAPQQSGTASGTQQVAKDAPQTETPPPIAPPSAPQETRTPQANTVPPQTEVTPPQTDTGAPANETPLPQAPQTTPPDTSPSTPPTPENTQPLQEPASIPTDTTETIEDSFDDLQDLIAKSIQSQPETAQEEMEDITSQAPASEEVAKTEEKEEEEEEKDSFTLPSADPLDIWEQDAIKREQQKYNRAPTPSVKEQTPAPQKSEVSEWPEQKTKPVQPQQETPPDTKETSTLQDTPVDAQDVQKTSVPQPTPQAPTQPQPTTAKPPTEQPPVADEQKAPEPTPGETHIPIASETSDDATSPQQPSPQEKEKQPTPSPTDNDSHSPEATQQKSSGASNLSALRERVLQQNAQESISGNTPAPAKEKPPETEVRPRPASKHASAIADVADKLHALNTDGTPESRTQSPQVQQETPIPEEELTPVERAILNDKKRSAGDDKRTKNTAPQAPPTQESTDQPTVPLVRTFRSDVERTVMKNKTSVVDMVSAQEKKRSLGETVRFASHQKETSVLSYVFVGASIILLMVGLLISGYFTYRHFFGDRLSDTPQVVPVNETLQHDVTNSSGEALLIGLTKIRKALQANRNELTELRLTERFNDEDSTTVRVVEPAGFFSKLDSEAPGPLVRNVGENMSLGLHALQENEPYWVFNVDHYETAFKGMLDWEDTIRTDLAPFFGEVDPPELVPANSDSTQSGTSTRYVRRGPEDVFKDIIVSNKEARVLVDEKGETLLIWSIHNGKNVIITTNNETFEVLLERMNTLSQ